MLEQIEYHTSTNVVVWDYVMAQAIRNIKAGQRFLVIDKEDKGFKEGTIVEALESKDNISDTYWFNCKWVGGTNMFSGLVLGQSIKHLKRFKGKIKWQKMKIDLLLTKIDGLDVLDIDG